MDEKIKIIEAKQLRGEIIKQLYKFYPDGVSLTTLKMVLRYKKYYAEEELKRAVGYLQGDAAEAGSIFIRLQENTDDYWDSVVKLTSIGINLAEGDEKNKGVLFDE